MNDSEVIVQQRRQLESDIAGLAELLQAGLVEQPLASDLETLLHDIACDLRQLILLKEQHGFFDELVDLVPHQEYTVKRLRADHRILLQELRYIEGILVHDYRPLRARRLIRGWLSRFRELDKREATLLHNALNVDIGAVD